MTIEERKKKTIDLTQGSIWKVFVLFALPLFGGSLFQQLYSTADLMFVGNFIGKRASAAVGASSLLVTLLIDVFVGISVGASIVVSGFAGSKDEEKMRQTINTTIRVGVIGGLVLMVAAIVMARQMLVWMKTPESVMADATLYIRVYFLAMVPMILYNICSAVLRSMGDAKTPFRVLAVGGFVNVVLDAICIVFLHGGVAGMAIATCLSQTFTAGVLLYNVLRHVPGVLGAGVHLDHLREVLRLGLPVGVQSMLMVLSNVAIQYFINGFGEDPVAGFTIYHKAESLLYLPIIAFGQAMTTFVGQNRGAKRYDRINQAAIICNGFAAGVTVVLAVLCLIGRKWIVLLFCKDGNVIEIAAHMMAITFPAYFLYSLQEVTGGMLRGLGRSMESMIVSVTNLCVIRVLLLYMVYRVHYTMTMIMIVFPVTWAITVCGYWFCYNRWKGQIR